MQNELTFEELIEAVKGQWDVWYLMEVLDLPFEEIVDALRDKIEEQYDKVLEELE